MNIHAGKQLRWALAIAAFGLALGGANSARANLLVNGSFEDGVAIPGGFTTIFNGDSTSITGWVVGGLLRVNNSVDYIGNYWQAADGTRSIDLSGTTDCCSAPIQWGEISQTFATTPGQQYKVSFQLSGNPDGAPQEKVLDVAVASFVDQFTYDIVANGTTIPSPMNWILVSFLFTANELSETLTFRSSPTDNNTYYGPAIDAVDVSAVPIPAALPLFAGGLGLLGWLARRRQRAEARFA